MLTAPSIQRIVSGGQTGVDRAALDVAIELGIQHGGWCPRGRTAEDGVIPIEYQLSETSSRHYWVRTEQNVIDSDGTLILYQSRLSGGTEFTYRMTRKHSKPCYLFDLAARPEASLARDWIAENAIKQLNCAGPRESTSPGIGQLARQSIYEILASMDTVD